jgi:hypothetical protein
MVLEPLIKTFPLEELWTGSLLSEHPATRKPSRRVAHAIREDFDFERSEDSMNVVFMAHVSTGNSFRD